MVFLLLLSMASGTVYQRVGVKKPIVKLDTEVTSENKANYNLILVGGPNVNSLVRELDEAGKIPVDIAAAPSGEGFLILLEDPWGTGMNVLIVAGPDREGTRKAMLELFDLLR
ncbi:MAG: S-layer protein [Candidatus Hydrothermarchaeota archaeon]